MIALGIDAEGRKYVLGLGEGATESGAQVQERARPSPPRAVARLCQQGAAGCVGTSTRRTARRGCWNGWRGRWSVDHPGAAASIREGLDETLTVQRLGLDGGAAAYAALDEHHREPERERGALHAEREALAWRPHDSTLGGERAGGGGEALPVGPRLPRSAAPGSSLWMRWPRPTAWLLTWRKIDAFVGETKGSPLLKFNSERDNPRAVRVSRRATDRTARPPPPAVPRLRKPVRQPGRSAAERPTGTCTRRSPKRSAGGALAVDAYGAVQGSSSASAPRVASWLRRQRRGDPRRWRSRTRTRARPGRCWPTTGRYDAIFAGQRA